MGRIFIGYKWGEFPFVKVKSVTDFFLQSFLLQQLPLKHLII